MGFLKSETLACDSLHLRSSGPSVVERFSLLGTLMTELRRDAATTLDASSAQERSGASALPQNEKGRWFSPAALKTMIDSVKITLGRLRAATAEQTEHSQTTEQSCGWFWNSIHDDVVERQTCSSTEEEPGIGGIEAIVSTIHGEG